MDEYLYKKKYFTGKSKINTLRNLLELLAEFIKFLRALIYTFNNYAINIKFS